MSSEVNVIECDDPSIIDRVEQGSRIYLVRLSDGESDVVHTAGIVIEFGSLAEIDRQAAEFEMSFSDTLYHTVSMRVAAKIWRELPAAVAVIELREISAREMHELKPLTPADECMS